MSDELHEYVCDNCNFKSFVLKVILRHIYLSHNQNFRVKCRVPFCELYFTKYNSLYRHTVRHHPELYNGDVVTQNTTVHHTSNEHDEPEISTIDDHSSEDRTLCDGAESNGDATSSDENTSSDSDSSSSDESSYSDTEEDDDNHAHPIINNNFEENKNDPDMKDACCSFILKVKDKHNLSQASLESIMESTKYLSNVTTALLKEKIKTVLEQHNFAHVQEIDNLFDESPQLFEGLETLPLQNKYIAENYDMLPFKEIVLGNKMKYKRKGRKRIITEAQDKFVYIPIIESLQQLFKDLRMRKELLKKPMECGEKGFLFDFQDGQIFKNDSYFKDHHEAVALVIFHDEVEVCNPLGSKAGKHKLDMYYYTIANLSPKFRSRHCAVRLLAIAKSTLVKSYGVDCILKPIVNDLMILYNGVDLMYENKILRVYGKVIACTGDTLGQHLWAGFKEGVGVAFSKCRHCHCDFESMQTSFREENFVLRNKVNHKREANLIESAPTEAAKETFSLLYGINNKSILLTLPDFDVIKQLPQDVMHTIAEGVLQYETRLILLNYIKNNQLTLEQINGAIEKHSYGYTEISDSPPPLKDTVFTKAEGYKLKYNAAQARLFLRLLPFYLMPFINAHDMLYQFLIDLSEIVQIIYSPVITTETVSTLRTMIFDHLTQFKQLFPDKNIIPKQHYLVHIPTSVLLLGPAIRSSCYSFEATHKYFKKIAQKQNFKNICLSLARKYQRLNCVEFGLKENTSKNHPVFSKEMEHGVVRSLDDKAKKDLRVALDNFSLLPGVELKMPYTLSWTILNGTKYTRDGFLIVSVSTDANKPIFGKIAKIWLIKGYIYFEVEIYRTLEFDRNFQAYLVENISRTTICPYERLVDFNVLNEKVYDTRIYLQPKYNINDLLELFSLSGSPFFNC